MAVRQQSVSRGAFKVPGVTRPSRGWGAERNLRRKLARVKVQLFDLRRRTCPEAMVPWGRLAPRMTDQLPEAVAKQRTSGDPWFPGKGEDRAREI